MIEIVDEVPAHVGAREALLDLSFGPDRFAKTSERLREGRLPAFAFVALDDDGELVGTVRLWNVVDGTGQPALLLGPLAVSQVARSGGIGGRLMRHALNQAAVNGHGAVLLVGDFAYYKRFGFEKGHLDAVTLPGPVDHNRFLAMELRAGTVANYSGCLAASGAMDFPQAKPMEIGVALEQAA